MYHKHHEIKYQGPVLMYHKYHRQMKYQGPDLMIHNHKYHKEMKIAQTHANVTQVPLGDENSSKDQC